MANTVFLGAPMQMQCKETHKCSQNQISRVRVKFSKSPAESPEIVDRLNFLRATLFRRGRELGSSYTVRTPITVLNLISQSATQD